MKMDIIESDLKQLFMWIKTATDSLSVLEELCNSQQALIRTLEERIINIEHDLALVLSVIKDRKNST